MAYWSNASSWSLEAGCHFQHATDVICINVVVIESKHSSQELRDAVHGIWPLQTFKQKDFKAKGLVIIANKSAMNLFFWLDQYCLKFRYISDIIDTWMHIVIYLSSEVKPMIFCEHKAL
jgi:hypothetical protein